MCTAQKNLKIIILRERIQQKEVTYKIMENEN